MVAKQPSIFERHQDKFWHFFAGGAAAFIVATPVHHYFPQLPDGYWQGLGLGAGVLLASAKELWDKLRVGGSGWNWWDAAWTVAGDVVVIVGLRWGWS